MFNRYLCCAVLMVSVTACTAPQTRLLNQQHAALVARPSVELLDVPFFSQETHQCGPAALATMLQQSGVKILPEQLVPEVYVPKRKGSFSLEMIASARQHERLAYPLAPNLNAIFTALDAGFPVLVLQNNGLASYPVWHFAVVVGVDYQQGQLILRSGHDKRLILPFSTFEYTWARSQYWASLVLDPAQLPAWLAADKALQQLAILEKRGSVQTAQQGFKQATLHWPNEKGAWLGLGNSSATLGDIKSAEAAFKELIRRYPNEGAGLNNLADLLLQSGRAQEALGYAQRAVTVLDTTATQATLAAVKKALIEVH